MLDVRNQSEIIELKSTSTIKSKTNSKAKQYSKIKSKQLSSNNPQK